MKYLTEPRIFYGAAFVFALWLVAPWFMLPAPQEAPPSDPPSPPKVEPIEPVKPEPKPEPKRKLLWHYDRNSAQRQAEEIGGVVVIYMHRDGCPPCQRMWADYMNTAAFSRTCLEKKIVPMKAIGTNVSTPRLVFQGGPRHDETLIGWQGKEKTEQWLRQ